MEADREFTGMIKASTMVRLEELARSTGKSLDSLVEQAVEEYLANHDGQFQIAVRESLEQYGDLYRRLAE